MLIRTSVVSTESARLAISSAKVMQYVFLFILSFLLMLLWHVSGRHFLNFWNIFFNTQLHNIGEILYISLNKTGYIWHATFFYLYTTGLMIGNLVEQTMYFLKFQISCCISTNGCLRSHLPTPICYLTVYIRSAAFPILVHCLLLPNHDVFFLAITLLHLIFPSSISYRNWYLTSRRYAVFYVSL